LRRPSSTNALTGEPVALDAVKLALKRAGLHAGDPIDARRRPKPR